MTTKRRPEKDLTVLWQRHLPQGYGGSYERGDTLDEDDARIDALANLAVEFEKVITDFSDELEQGDLVVTISRRPPIPGLVPTPNPSEGRSAPEGPRGDPLTAEPDPRDLVVTYGEHQRGQRRYVLAARGFGLRTRLGGSFRQPKAGQVVFQSDRKSEVIAEAQRRKGWEPVDGSEQTYGRQISEHDGESR